MARAGNKTAFFDHDGFRKHAVSVGSQRRFRRVRVWAIIPVLHEATDDAVADRKLRDSRADGGRFSGSV